MGSFTKYILISLFSLLLFPVAGSALTLGQALEKIKNHPRIEAARLDAKASIWDKRAQASLPDPKVGLEFEDIPSGTTSFGNAGQTNYSVSQLIPFPGKLAKKYAAAKAIADAKKQVLTKEERDIIFLVKKTYYELYANSQMLAAKKAVFNNLSALASSLTEQFKTNQSSENTSSSGAMGAIKTNDGLPLSVEVLSSKMSRATVETEIHDLTHQRASLQAKLNLLMGEDPENPIGNLSQPPFKMINQPAKKLASKIDLQNSDILEMKALEKSASKSVGVASLGLVPDIEPMLTYNKIQNAPNTYTASVGLNFPLWINRNIAEISQAKALAMKSRANLENTRRDVTEAFYYLFNHAKEHHNIVTKYKNEIVPLAKSAMDISMEAFKAGGADANRVIPRVMEFHDAQVMNWQMWTDYMTEYALLEKLIGETL